MDKYYCVGDLIEPIEVDKAIEAILSNDKSQMPGWLINFNDNNRIIIQKHGSSNRIEFKNIDSCYKPTYAYSTQIVFLKNSLVEVIDSYRFERNYRKV
jgi:hypothetical protein